uniref:Uncharacterized protein n=1 Tax=Fundulus heteroclitus TaxID=8078 RepID=A0A3Q2PFH3_FUNHE
RLNPFFQLKRNLDLYLFFISSDLSFYALPSLSRKDFHSFALCSPRPLFITHP